MTECNTVPRSKMSHHLHAGNVVNAYGVWEKPCTIISDGAYGVGGFPGDPRKPDDLADWYAPHIAAWSRAATPATTLWFWNTEVGWATVHPLLLQHGWEYVQLIVWDKGISHIAGNVNGDTIRHYPVVTEVCAFYRRTLRFTTNSGAMNAKEWLRFEWQRAGFPLNRANEACGVKNAATRKYLTQDWLWYFPPPEMMELLVAFANEHGDPAGRPYYSLDGVRPVTGSEWGQLRHPWTHQHGITNVWSHPPLHGEERYRRNPPHPTPGRHKPTKRAAAHLNQKPLEFMRRIIKSCSNVGDVIWEPFGGLCSASVAAIELGRRWFAAEILEEYYAIASERLEGATNKKTAKQNP